jgi:hypothetical protein
MTRETKRVTQECDKKAADLALAQKTMASLEKLEKQRSEAVARANHHLISQDLSLFHEVMTKTFADPGSASARRVGIPIRSNGLVSVRKCCLSQSSSTEVLIHCN